MKKEDVREDLIEIIDICKNCIKFLDDNETYIEQKIAMRLSVMDIKLMKLAKALKWGIK